MQTTKNKANEKHLTLVLSINFRWLCLQCTQNIKGFLFCFVFNKFATIISLPHRTHRLVALCLLFYSFASEECDISLSLSLNHYLMILMASILNFSVSWIGGGWSGEILMGRQKMTYKYVVSLSPECQQKSYLRKVKFYSSETGIASDTSFEEVPPLRC